MNRVKEEFNTYKTFVEMASKEELINFMKESYQTWEANTHKDIVKYVLEFHQRFKFWGNLNPAINDYELIEDRATVLKTKWNLIEGLYNDLGDYRSKDVLIMILEHWLTFSYDRIEKVREYSFKSYFDMDLVEGNSEEVFVDLGGWKGDTIEDYIETYGENSLKKIYSYEILPTNLDILKNKFSNNKRINIRGIGVSDKKGTMYLSDNGSSDAQSLVENGIWEVETVSLDEDIEERITFLKMDIEGSEKKAIIGAKEHIKKEFPKMAISIYHSNSDLVEIYKLIKELQPNYKFYLRYYGLKYFPTDYILYCIPN